MRAPRLAAPRLAGTRRGSDLGRPLLRGKGRMLASWLETYGLWFVLIGSILEGEGVMLAAGFAISQGYLPAAPVFALAVRGATLGDHAYFLIGRRWGGRVLRRVAPLRRRRP